MQFWFDGLRFRFEILVCLIKNGQSGTTRCSEVSIGTKREKGPQTSSERCKTKCNDEEALPLTTLALHPSLASHSSLTLTRFPHRCCRDLHRPHAAARALRACALIAALIWMFALGTNSCGGYACRAPRPGKSCRQKRPA